MSSPPSPTATQIYGQIQSQIEQQRQQQQAAIAQAQRKPEPTQRGRGLQEKPDDEAAQLLLNQMHVNVVQAQTLSNLLAQYHAQVEAEFRAIEQRDQRGSRFQVGFTLVTSLVSLIMGWLLSLVKSPTVLFDLLHH